MARNYSEIQKQIALTGFFSEYLPPCFYLNPSVLNHTPPQKCALIPPYSFSMSRFNGNEARRTIFIPEIGSYIVAYMYMKENDIIKELIEFSESQHYSFSPILGQDDSIVRHEEVYDFPDQSPFDINSNYIENVGKKIILASGAKKILKLDISNCFLSFYMHMIPSIVLGIKQTEEEYEKSKRGETCIDQYNKYRKLDEVIRQQNLNRTNGLLPGILSSKIIAEAMLTRLDMELKEAGFNFVRYVDDDEVFLYGDDDEKKTISKFAKILKQYGFSLNYEKTEVVEFPYYIVDVFNKILGEKIKETMNTADLIDVFNCFLEMEKKGTKGAVRFLVKSLEQKSEEVRIENTDLYKSYLISIMANNERSLTKACSILINDKEEYTLSTVDVNNILRLLNRHIIYEHDLEVIWLLYLLIKTDNLESGNPIIDSIVGTQNELAYLVLLHNNLLDDQQKDTIKKKAHSWILLYEMYSNDMLSETEFFEKLSIHKNGDMYRKFKTNGIHFIV